MSELTILRKKICVWNYIPVQRFDWLRIGKASKNLSNCFVHFTSSLWLEQYYVENSWSKQRTATNVCLLFDWVFVYFFIFCHRHSSKNWTFCNQWWGLHLNFQGTEILRKRFINCLIKFFKDVKICIQVRTISFPSVSIKPVTGVTGNPTTKQESVIFENLIYLT